MAVDAPERASGITNPRREHDCGHSPGRFLKAGPGEMAWARDLERDILVLLSRVGFERGPEGVLVVTDPKTLGSKETGAGSPLPPPTPPPVKLSAASLVGVVSFTKRLNRMFDQFLLTGEAQPQGDKRRCAPVVVSGTSEIVTGNVSSPRDVARRPRVSRNPDTRTTRRISVEDLAAAKGERPQELRDAGEVCFDRLLSVLVKLQVKKPVNVLLTHEQLSAIATELKLKARDEAGKRRQRARELTKEAAERASPAAHDSPALDMALMWITVASLAPGVGAELLAAPRPVWVAFGRVVQQAIRLAAQTLRGLGESRAGQEVGDQMAHLIVHGLGRETVVGLVQSAGDAFARQMAQVVCAEMAATVGFELRDRFGPQKSRAVAEELTTHFCERLCGDFLTAFAAHLPRAAAVDFRGQFEGGFSEDFVRLATMAPIQGLEMTWRRIREELTGDALGLFFGAAGNGELPLHTRAEQSEILATILAAKDRTVAAMVRMMSKSLAVNVRVMSAGIAR